MWSIARSDARRQAELERSLPVPIEIRRIRSARRFRLRFDPATGTLKMSAPWRSSRRAALSWALDQREWIDAQLARALPGEPFTEGATIPLEGGVARIAWNPGWPRSPVLVGDELRVGGPRDGLAGRVEHFLKRRARDVLSDDVAHFAAMAGANPSRLSVGDASTRWGSCSSSGRIRISWRLILAPPAVRRYVAAHEVAHLVHMNHGPDFKALEERLFGPGLAEAKSELRRLGPRLKRIGRG